LEIGHVHVAGVSHLAPGQSAEHTSTRLH
jgi:hypothetical protein